MKHLRILKPVGLLLSFSIASLLTSCANGVNQGIVPTNYQGSAIADNTSGLVGNGFDCPSYTNISGTATDSLNNYTACLNLGNSSEVLLQGVGTYSNEICVFAAMTSGNEIFPVYNTSGTLAVACVNISSAEAEFSFPGISFNSLYVVDQSDESTMSTCLTANNPNECPPYSFGEFR